MRNRHKAGTKTKVFFKISAKFRRKLVALALKKRRVKEANLWEKR